MNGDVRRLEGMSTDLPEVDWKAFRKLREAALERFCERILGEVSQIVSEPEKTSHARYLAAYELIQIATTKSPARSTTLGVLWRYRSWL